MHKLITHNSKLTTKPVYAVVLVGGKGKRLRPISSLSTPKAFLSITKDKKTMFRRTIERIRRLVPSKNILVIANKAHAKLVRQDFPEIDVKNLILEPLSRNTAPAIYLAALVLKSRHEDAIMVVLPTDQYMIDKEKYLSSIKKGIDFVEEHRDSILVLGVEPKFPSTHFGYIKLTTHNSKLKTNSISRVERFTEKPNLDTAKRYVRSRKYLWNTGAFIFTRDTISMNIRRFASDIYERLQGTQNINKIYKKLPDISIDYAVMEKADDIYCIKGSYRWRDMGTFDSIREILKKESIDSILKDGKMIKIL